MRQALSKGLAESVSKHQVKYVVQQFGEVRSYGGCEHANALEDSLFLRRVFLSVRWLSAVSERTERIGDDTYPRCRKASLMLTMIGSRKFFISLATT